MSTGSRVILPMFLVLAACGGGGGDGGGVSVNAFTGTLNIGAGTVGATCAVTHTVTFTAAGADPQTVNAAGGDCVTFTVSDGTAHVPVAREATGCDALTVGRIDDVTTSRTTVPLPASRVCHWADNLNLPPPPPGGGGGGAGY